MMIGQLSALEGVDEETVNILSYDHNIVLLGDGRDVTLITGNRSVVDDWTTSRAATLSTGNSNASKLISYASLICGDS